AGGRAGESDVPRRTRGGRAHRDRHCFGDALRRGGGRAHRSTGGAGAAGGAGSTSVRRQPFGPTGVAVPVVGQGTWNMERDGRAAAVAALRAGLDLGMTHIDTAEMYGSGRVEELVGEAIAGRREQVFLVSKVLPQNASRAGVLRACEASLRRLRTDRLDCYLLHWPGRHPLADTIAAFEQLRREGKVRAWGGRVLAEIAAAHGATARQVALAFLVRAPGLFTIPKAGCAAHVAENAAAGDLALSAEDVWRIDAAFPRGRWRGLPML